MTIGNAHATGPFTSSQLTRIADALAAADHETGLLFSVYVGELTPPPSDDRSAELPTTTQAARVLHAALPTPNDAVLMAVSPNQRVVEIVTGGNLAHRLPDQTCALIALSAVTSFTGGDLTGGIVTAFRMLAERARS